MSAEIQTTGVGLFNFRKMKSGEILLTNLNGNYLFLSEDEFVSFRDGGLRRS